MLRPLADCSGPAIRMLFSVRHAVTHASHPVHRSRSTAIPHRCVIVSSSPLERAAGPIRVTLPECARRLSEGEAHLCGCSGG